MKGSRITCIEREAVKKIRRDQYYASMVEDHTMFGKMAAREVAADPKRARRAPICLSSRCTLKTTRLLSTAVKDKTPISVLLN